MLPPALRDALRRDGRLTVARYMELALYDETSGYYAASPRRSGRSGDFYTSVDAGPLFGELLAVQFQEMGRVLGTGDWALGTGTPGAQRPAPSPQFDLVEAGAGDGRLARDVLDAAEALDPAFARAIRLFLVERSAAARQAQAATLGPRQGALAGAGPDLPSRVNGVIFANELLDAMPVHQVVMREDGLREVFVELRSEHLAAVEGPPSTPALAEYLERFGARLRPGWRTEVSLAAEAWVGDAARRLERGFLLLIDYGHEADVLYSASHAAGTLATYHGHVAEGAGAPSSGAPSWLQAPGQRDLTAHVNLTAVRRAAEGAGLDALGSMDQTYFLLGLGIAERLEAETSVRALRRRLAAKTLMLPGGLGSVQKVMIFGRGVGRPALRGCSFGTRVT